MKQNRIKKQKYVSEDAKQISNLMYIILGIMVIIAGLYFLTSKSLDNKNNNSASEVEFDYSTCTVGTMFNRPYEEYYVFLYESTNENANQYRSLTSSYEAKDSALKIYTVDLSSNLDNKYLKDISNSNPTNSSEVSIKESALILIKNGKVTKYYETTADYEKVLK